MYFFLLDYHPERRFRRWEVRMGCSVQGRERSWFRCTLGGARFLRWHKQGVTEAGVKRLLRVSDV